MLALLLIVAPVGGWIGWVMATRQLSGAVKLLLWGGVWSALLLTPLLLVAHFPLSLLSRVGAQGGAVMVLGSFSLAWLLLYSQRLFTVTGKVSDEVLYQLGVNHRSARFFVVRPLLYPWLLAAVAVVQLVLLFDSGVAMKLGLETLSVGYFVAEGGGGRLLLWLGWVVVALYMARSAYRKLPAVEGKEMESGAEKRRMGWLGGGATLFGLLLYLPLVVILGRLLNG